MKPFTFKLQTSLDIKDKQEDQQKAELQRITAIHQENVEILKSLELKLYDIQNQIRYCQTSSNNLNISEVTNLQEYLPFLKGKINTQIETIQMIEIEMEKAREVLIDISKEKKILEKLKFKHLEEYKKEMGRQEQILLDEMATNIYYRKEVSVN
jgi:flagellar protein FliJ